MRDTFQLDGQNLFDLRSLVSASLKRQLAANHHERPTLLYEVPYVVQIPLIDERIIAEILKYDEIERIEIISEQQVGRKWNEAQLRSRRGHVIAKRTQNEEGQQVHLGVVGKYFAQEPGVPCGPSVEMQDPDTVADDFYLKVASIVGNHRFAGK